MLSASIVGPNLVISWGLPQHGGSSILEGLLELRHSDGTTFSEVTAHCDLAEDSAVFDGRQCSIPLPAIWQETTPTNAYQLAQGTVIGMKLKFRNQAGWGPESDVYAPPTLLMQALPHKPTLAPSVIA